MRLCEPALRLRLVTCCEGPSTWRYLICVLDEHCHHDDSTKSGHDLE